MAPTATDESFSLDQLKAGDNQAWNSAFGCLYGLAFNVLKGINNSLSEADLQEVVRDAIISLIEHYVEKAESIEELKKLVITIAKNKARDLIDKQNAGMRSRAMTESLNATDDSGLPIVSEKNLVSDEADPADMADQVERAFLLNEALKELPPKQADLLRDYYFAELKQQEIADKHGLKLSSVGGYLNRALESLEKIVRKNKLL